MRAAILSNVDHLMIGHDFKHSVMVLASIQMLMSHSWSQMYSSRAMDDYFIRLCVRFLDTSITSGFAGSYCANWVPRYSDKIVICHLVSYERERSKSLVYFYLACPDCCLVWVRISRHQWNSTSAFLRGRGAVRSRWILDWFFSVRG